MVALRIGPFTLYWYGILVALAVLAGFLVARRLVIRLGLNPEVFDGLALLFVPTILIGARAAYVIAEWPYYREHPGEIIKTWYGGLGSHGAIFAMLIVGWIAARATAQPFWTLADAIAPAIPLAHVFVRLGNFLNRELYGLPTAVPWGMAVPGSPVLHHPSMLYEGIVSAGTFILSYHWAWGQAQPVGGGEVAAAKRPTRGGTAFLKTMVVVSVVRLLVDFTRPRPEPVWAGLILTQVLAAALIAGSLFLLATRRRPGTPAGG
ncbi:MAG TPA: prolipoprotein diacylglyceryl transferase [Bacillota bacterium]|nr:prolipoprotein diacylglyceryl transferase [Bacillota bacterium]